MFGLPKIKKSTFWAIIIGVIIALLILSLYAIPKKNVKVCDEYFRLEFESSLGTKERICEKAIKYNQMSKICYCEDGEHYLDANMIADLNEKIKERYNKELENASKIKNMGLSEFLSNVSLGR